MDWGAILENVRFLFGEAISSQAGQFGIAFTLAAWVHSGRVKSEIKTQMGQLSKSFDGLALALRQDLSTQDQRIIRVEVDLNELKTLKIKEVSNGPS